MKFSTKKFILQQQLEKAVSVVPSKDPLPVLKNFLVAANPTEVRVIATDLELSVVASTQLVSVEETGQALLPARKLLDMVKEAGDGDITVETTANTATISAGRAKWKLMLAEEKSYPKVTVLISSVDVSPIDRARFLRALRSVRHAAATDTYRHNLMMIDVHDGYMRASDGVRLQQIAVSDVPDMQIPIGAVDDLVKILQISEDDTIGFSQTPTSLVFQVSGDMFATQKPSSQFPDVTEMTLKPALANDLKLHVDRIELLAAIKRVRITADLMTNAVVLELHPDKIVVQSKDKYGSTCSEELDAEWDGKLRTVGFNHHHLTQMLQMATVDSCEFWLGKDTKTKPSPLMLKDEAIDMTGVLAQIRVDWLE